jgi:ribonuclease P protein component
MRVYESLRRRGDFARVRGRGKRFAGVLLTGFMLDGRRRTRIGITVAGTVGNAVVRNRLRRRLKAMFDRYPLGTPPWRDIVIIARPGAGEATFEALAGELARMMGTA